jgi:O-antigen/teichoic acid export membrane protein
VPILLGPRWDGTVPLLMILAPSAIVQTLGWLSRALLLGRGRSGLQFGLALLTAALTLAGVVAGMHFGIVGITVGVALAVVIGSLAYLIAAMRETQVTVRAMVAALGPTLVAAGFMTCGAAGLRWLLPANLPDLLSLLLTAGGGILLYGGAMHLLAPETLAAAIAPFFRRGRSVAERSMG